MRVETSSSARGRMCAWARSSKCSTVKRCPLTCSSSHLSTVTVDAMLRLPNIDGETNLKIHEMEPELGNLVRANGRPDPFELLNLRGTLQCETPNKNIHNFVGRLDIDGHAEPISVGSKQFLLRGSQLRNTPWVWGLVVYTGAETKVMKNSRDAPSKLSILEQTMNRCILLVLLTQMLVCALGAAGTCYWSDLNQPAFPFILVLGANQQYR